MTTTPAPPPADHSDAPPAVGPLGVDVDDGGALVVDEHMRRVFLAAADAFPAIWAAAHPEAPRG